LVRREQMDDTDTFEQQLVGNIPFLRLKGWLINILKNTFINQYHKNKYSKYFVYIDPLTLEGVSP